MSTTHPPRSLLRALVDDAAVFPPGNAPVPQAWSGHLALRAGGYGDLLGPLLIGTSGATTLVEAASGPERVDVGVIARAGTPVSDLLEAVRTLRAGPHTQVVSVELAVDAEGQWRRALDLGVPVAVEVGREASAQAKALDQIATAADGRATAVLAKLRTQSTPTSTVPSAAELAGFLDAARQRGLPFKLTGGLHHAIATTVEQPDGSSEDQHGVLNVLLATHSLEHGAGPDQLQADLESRDGQDLASRARGLRQHDIDVLRGRFRSFGCCGVTDPLDELADLGLISHPRPEGAR